MAIQTINLGSYANDGSGDDLRTAFQKVNANFSELNDITAIGGENLGSGTPVYAGMSAIEGSGDNLTFRSLVAGDNVTITNNATTITIEATDSINNLVEDTTPQLGGNLDLNGHNVSSSNSFGLTSNNGSIGILAINTVNNNFNPIYLNSLSITGGNDVSGGGVSLATSNNTTLGINADLGLSFYTENILQIQAGNIQLEGTVVSSNNIVAPVFVGDTTGLHTGNVIGTVTGTVSSIANHNLSGLGDVSEVSPSLGNALVWNGTTWSPSDAGTTYSISAETTTGGANIRLTGADSSVDDLKIASGSNVTITRTDASTITISATGGGSGDLDFGSFASPAGFTLDLGTF